MATVDDAVQSQARNIELATGRSIDAWVALVKASGTERHSEIVAWLKAEHGFSHGNANLVALTAKRGSVAGGGDELVDAMYAGPKATLRPFHDQVIELARGFGDDVELAPKQAYVSLRRSKQFGTVGPGPWRAARDRAESQGHRARRAGWRPPAGCAPIGSDCRRSTSSTTRSSAGSERPTSEPDRSTMPHGGLVATL